MTIDHSLDGKRAARDRARLVEGPRTIAAGGGGPHDPGMNARVTALEADIKDVKAGVSRLESGQATMMAKLDSLATAADLATLGGQFVGLQERIAAQSQRMTAIETAMSDMVKVALSKTIGIAGAIALFVSMTAVVAAVVTAMHAFHLV